MNSPLLFLTFNRPQETAVVFEEAIRKYRPSKLYMATDGPRPGRKDDETQCRAVREIISRVDWDCEVKTLFREQNLGCKNAVSSAISWFFEQEEQGIILEDDCLPNEDFFRFCDTLLPYYKEDEKVMHIGGNNFQDGIKRGDGSYYFSSIPHVWGWASWRRAWKQYDIYLSDLETVKKNNHLPLDEKSFWFHTFKRVKQNEINTWDYQWTYSLWKAGGKAIIPQVNLVTNIGFGTSATHTSSGDDDLSSLKTYPLKEITHPGQNQINREADRYWYKKVIPWQLKLKSFIKYLGD